MGETKLKIIALIEPYMDKTWKKGCLFKWIDYPGHYADIKNGDIDEFISLNEMKSGDIDFWFFSQRIDITDEIIPNLMKHIEIIGHYDITSILKNIHEKWCNYRNNDGDSITIFGNRLEKNYTIPNKPLHLFTESEEKSLLKILLKLNEI